MEEEKASREEMKLEAIRRLMTLKVHSDVIKELINNDRLYRSEHLQGFLFWLDDKEKEMVEEFERKRNVYVYHVIKTNTLDMGIIYDLLYITQYKDEWQFEREDAKNGYVLSYTKAHFLESGCIVIDGVNGGLVRML